MTYRTFYEGKKHMFDFIEQYSQFFSSCNWYTFQPIFIEIEDDRHLGGFEITVVFMGLGLRWRWNHTETETRKEMCEAVKRILEEKA